MIKLMNPNNNLFWANRWRGDSGDTKPTLNVRNGDEFFEVDTSKLYMYDAENKVWIEWVKVGEQPVNLINPEANE